MQSSQLCSGSSFKVGECLQDAFVPFFNLFSHRHTALFCPYFDHVCLRYGCPHSAHTKISVSAYLELCDMSHNDGYVTKNNMGQSDIEMV